MGRIPAHPTNFIPVDEPEMAARRRAFHVRLENQGIQRKSEYILR